MVNNLIYVFLSSNFHNKDNKNKSQWSYESLPDYYIKTFVKNSQIFESSYFIAETEQIKKIKPLFPSYTQFISVEDVITPTDTFREVQETINTLWARYKHDTFWYVTFIRTIVLGILIRDFNLKNTVHVEADNIIFADQTNTLFDALEEGDFGYSNEAPHASALALMAFKDSAAGGNIVKHHLSLLKKGDTTLNPHVGHFCGHVTDMAFIDLIYRARKNYKMLPCLPYGQFSENFEQIQYVFDPIPYGFFLAGNNHGAQEGHVEYRHYVGKEIAENKIKVVFDKAPYIIYNGSKIPIFNLHIHNKRRIPYFLNG